MNRSNVVSCARSMLGTPYHHQARLPGIGLDCIGLVICVARQCGLVPSNFEIPTYSRMPDGRLMPQAGEYMTSIAQSEMQIADVVVLALDTEPQHFGILADYRHGGFSIIHAANDAGKVIETRLMFHASFKFVAAFCLPGVH